MVVLKYFVPDSHASNRPFEKKSENLYNACASWTPNLCVPPSLVKLTLCQAHERMDSRFEARALFARIIYEKDSYLREHVCSEGNGRVETPT